MRAKSPIYIFVKKKPFLFSRFSSSVDELNYVCLWLSAGTMRQTSDRTAQ